MADRVHVYDGRLDSKFNKPQVENGKHFGGSKDPPIESQRTGSKEHGISCRKYRLRSALGS